MATDPFTRALVLFGANCSNRLDMTWFSEVFSDGELHMRHNIHDGVFDDGILDLGGSFTAITDDGQEVKIKGVFVGVPAEIAEKTDRDLRDPETIQEYIWENFRE